jgi:hypothetical protein
MFWRRANEGDYWQGRFDAIQERAPKVMRLIVSMIQTAGQLAESGKPSEALKLTSEAKEVFRDFHNELDEVATQLARQKGSNTYKTLKKSGITDSMATLEADLDLFEKTLREGNY